MVSNERMEWVNWSLCIFALWKRSVGQRSFSSMHVVATPQVLRTVMKWVVCIYHYCVRMVCGMEIVIIAVVLYAY